LPDLRAKKTGCSPSNFQKFEGLFLFSLPPCTREQKPYKHPDEDHSGEGIMEKGLLIVHTGNGKGKTTAALGLAMRALGHKQKVCVIQFIKGGWQYGELLSAKRFEDLLDFHVMGNGFTWTSREIRQDREIARQAWDFAKTQIASDKYQLVILDELTFLMTFGFIRQAEVIEELNRKREDLHVVVTGRDAPQALIDAADIVTDMIEMKHPFKNGIKAQKGIEF
jgi:cob(I)alamin adenosyltransferase